ncbi:MAG: toprim domain-containing protein [candidate division Zixibacteria bacterium]|nr:toprim domain-containing protein [candidate division Zixibacteria bacterium]
MAKETPGYINVEALMQEVSFEQAVAYYGVPLPEIHRIGNEVRMRCFLNCGRKDETGDRALAVQVDHPAKIWRCHQYGCGKGGNLVSLCDLLKPGQHADGKPRGQRFKEILADLRAMAAGVMSAAAAEPPTERQSATPASTPPPDKPPVANVPLAQSDNERARGLVNLDQKFIVDVAEMSPRAASYFRSRPFLTPEACRKWRMGYLPRDTGGDHAGGTMRGKIVYPMLSEEGEALTWFGRDPEFEAKHHEWLSGGKQGREPEKFHFVKGFHRGLELFGQHRLREEGIGEKVKELGLIVVEGPNDVIAMDALGVPAVGLCSNRLTKEQATKLARYAAAIGNGVVTLMLDCDLEGEAGARQAAVELAQLCAVRFAWLPSMHGGAFKGRQPESLRREEWEEVRESLGLSNSK